MNAPVDVRIEGPVGVIELARPERFNCLSRAVWAAIDGARRRFEADTGVRAILIRAQGKHFCTGADLDEVRGVRGTEDELRAFLRTGLDALEGLERSPLPVVAAVQGLCLAGGLELMLAADVVFAAATARFGDQHAQFGLVPGWGGSQRLVRAIGLRRALDLMFSARWIDAAEARQFGLVSHVVEDEGALVEAALAYCTKLGERSRVGLAEMKRLGREGIVLPLAGGIQLEFEASAAHLAREEVTEGLAAFAEKRQPRFS